MKKVILINYPTYYLNNFINFEVEDGKIINLSIVYKLKVLENYLIIFGQKIELKSIRTCCVLVNV